MDADKMALLSLTAEQEKWSPYNFRSTINEQPLSREELNKTTQYLHATLYLCLGKQCDGELLIKIWGIC